MRYHEFTPDPETVAARIAEGGVVTGAAQAAAGGPPPRETPAALPATLAGLTALRDREFLDAAYRVILGREPDPTGSAHYLAALRSGTVDKIEVLGDLRYSPEGAQRAVPLPGLDKRYRLRRFGRMPVVGRLFRWLLALARLPMLVATVQRHQAEMELAQLAGESQAAAMRRYQSDLRELRGDLRRLSTRLETAEGALQDLRETFDLRHERLAAANLRFMQQLRATNAAVAGLAPRPLAPAPAPPYARGVAAEAFDALYVDFEDRFRGSREETKRAQEIYLDYVAAADAGTAAAPVVDVGCGRGEWLELLHEHGCVARGVDLNGAMAAENRARGLDVAESDALSYLGALPGNSVGMVTGFHIIEHLPFDVLVRLFDECLRVLKPGGCVLFETPNPENLVVGAYTFYLDPTHRNPLPPQLVEFVAGQRGFGEVEIRRLHPRPEAGADDALLDRWFRAPTDYAVIAWKGGRATR